MQIAVVVPFREQLPLQDRGAQLRRFIPHMEAFLTSMPGCQAMIFVVEQSADGRKFNRGQLLNVGFRLAQAELPALSFFIMHDVDLLPSADMARVYASVPPERCAVHLASVWGKYGYGGFIGGVLGFRPADFERVNGFPNNYWGWGLEDDQLALRMANADVRTLRVREGSYSDLDPLNMKAVLESGRRDVIREHAPWLNPEMFRRGGLDLDPAWNENGVRSVAFELAAATVVKGCTCHATVRLTSDG